jgi:hypothetical protein
MRCGYLVTIMTRVEYDVDEDRLSYEDGVPDKSEEQFIQEIKDMTRTQILDVVEGQEKTWELLETSSIATEFFLERD